MSWRDRASKSRRNASSIPLFITTVYPDVVPSLENTRTFNPVDTPLASFLHWVTISNTSPSTLFDIDAAASAVRSTLRNLVTSNWLPSFSTSRPPIPNRRCRSSSSSVGSMGSSTTNASVPVFVSTLWLSTRKDRPHRCNTVLFFSEGESSTTPSQHGRSTPVDSRFVLKSTYDCADWNSPSRYLRACSDMVALLFLGSPS